MTTTTKDDADGVTMGWMPPWLYDTLVYTFTLGGEERQRLEILELVDIQEGAVVVDIGCGTGSLVLLAANETQAGHIIGVDPTETYIERAKAKKKGGGDGDNDDAKKVEFLVGKAQALPLEDESVDVTLSTFTFHHLSSTPLQKEALTEMKRVLRPGGKAVIVDFPAHHHRHQSSTTSNGIGDSGHQQTNHCKNMMDHLKNIINVNHGDDHRIRKDSDDITSLQDDDEGTENDDLVHLVENAGFTDVRTQKVSMMGAQAILASKA